MEDKKEYIATYTDSRQISPDDWSTFHPTIKLTDDTTIGEIRQWWLNVHGMNKKVKMELTLIEL